MYGSVYPAFELILTEHRLLRPTANNLVHQGLSCAGRYKARNLFCGNKSATRDLHNPQFALLDKSVCGRSAKSGHQDKIVDTIQERLHFWGLFPVETGSP